MIYKNIDSTFVPKLNDSIYTNDEWRVVVRQGKVSDVYKLEEEDYIFVFRIKTETKTILRNNYVARVISPNTLEFVDESSIEYDNVVSTVLRYIRENIDSGIIRGSSDIENNTRKRIIDNIFRAKWAIENNKDYSNGFIDESSSSWIIEQILSTKTITILDDDFNILNGVISNIRYPFYIVHRLDFYVKVTRVYENKIVSIYNPLSSRRINSDDIYILNKIKEQGIDLFYYHNDLETYILKKWSNFPLVLECIYNNSNDLMYREFIKSIIDLTCKYKYSKSSNQCIMEILKSLEPDVSNNFRTKLASDLQKYNRVSTEPRVLDIGSYRLTLTEFNINIMGDGINSGKDITTLGDLYDFLYVHLGSKSVGDFIGYETEIEKLYYGWMQEYSAIELDSTV